VSEESSVPAATFYRLIRIKMADNEQLVVVVADRNSEVDPAPADDPSDEVNDLDVRVAAVVLDESAGAEREAAVIEVAEFEKVSTPPSEAPEVSQPVPSTEATPAGAQDSQAEVHTPEAAVQSTEPVASTEPVPSTPAEQSTQPEPVQSTPAVQSTDPVESTAAVQSVPQSSSESQSPSVQEGQTTTAAVVTEEASPASGQAPETPAASTSEPEKDEAAPTTAEAEKTPKTPKTAGEKKFSFCKTS
jgi:hypothetical protein